MKSKQVSKDGGVVSTIVGVLVGILVANYSVILQAQQEHRQVIKNVNFLSCVNRLIKGTPLSQAKHQSEADWNTRYLTSYYNSVWADLVQEFGTTTWKFVGVVETMENTNIILDRIDRLRPQGTDRNTAFRDLSAGVDNVNILFDALNINEEICNELLNSGA